MLPRLQAQAEKDSRARSLLAERPQVPWHLQSYLNAFNYLSHRRQAGFSGMQPLSMEAVIEYGEKMGFSGVWPFYLRVIDELDSEWLEAQARKLKAAQPKGKKK